VDFPGIEYFCVTAGLVIISLFALTVTLFASLLVFDERRRLNKRYDCAFCIAMPSGDGNGDDEDAFSAVATTHQSTGGGGGGGGGDLEMISAVVASSSAPSAAWASGAASGASAGERSADAAAVERAFAGAPPLPTRAKRALTPGAAATTTNRQNQKAVGSAPAAAVSGGSAYDGVGALIDSTVAAWVVPVVTEPRRAATVCALAVLAGALGLASAPAIDIGIPLADAFPDGSYVTQHLALVGDVFTEMPSELYIVAEVKEGCGRLR